MGKAETRKALLALRLHVKKSIQYPRKLRSDAEKREAWLMKVVRRRFQDGERAPTPPELTPTGPAEPTPEPAAEVPPTTGPAANKPAAEPAPEPAAEAQPTTDPADDKPALAPEPVPAPPAPVPAAPAHARPSTEPAEPTPEPAAEELPPLDTQKAQANLLSLRRRHFVSKAKEELGKELGVLEPTSRQLDSKAKLLMRQDFRCLPVEVKRELVDLELPKPRRGLCGKYETCAFAHVSVYIWQKAQNLIKRRFSIFAFFPSWA